MEIARKRPLALVTTFLFITVATLHFASYDWAIKPAISQMHSLDHTWLKQPMKLYEAQPCSWWKKEPALPDQSNGFIIIDCYGGLNQMRRDFCDGVGVARMLNATLLLPQFEVSTYWNDTSGFADIFDADYFIEAMKGFINVVKQLPPELASKQPAAVDCQKRKMFDYVETVLPILMKHKVVSLRPSAAQRSDRYPEWAKSTRCQACYRALRLVDHIQQKAKVILENIPRPFMSLHLRFEPDMIAYSRCTYSNLSNKSIEAIEAAREKKNPFTGDMAIAWRNRGKCPLTPAEAAFILQALKIPRDMPIYLASGSGLEEEEGFTNIYSNIYRKSDILSYETLDSLHDNSKAALDYYVSVNSDVYAATYFGNMDKMVVAMRVLEKTGKTVVLNRKAFAMGVSSGVSRAKLDELMWEVHKPMLESGRSLPLPDCICHR